MGLESAFSSQRGVLLGGLDRAVQRFVSWSRRRALSPLVIAGSCCGDVALPILAQAFGLPPRQLGAAGPRDVDLLILAGPLARKNAPALVRLHAQIPEPKWVMTLGSCAFDGGAADHACIDPASVLTVHVRVPGCPPRPEAIRAGLERIDRLIRDERLDARQRPRRNTTGGIRTPVGLADSEDGR